MKKMTLSPILQLSICSSCSTRNISYRHIAHSPSRNLHMLVDSNFAIFTFTLSSSLHVSCEREYAEERQRTRLREMMTVLFRLREKEIEAWWLDHHCCALGNSRSYGSRPSSLSPTQHHLHHLKRPICLFNCDLPHGCQPSRQICTTPSTQPRTLIFLARPLSLSPLNPSLTISSFSIDHAW
jgi:hypothetical protein